MNSPGVGGAIAKAVVREDNLPRIAQPPDILEYQRPEPPRAKPVELALIPYAAGYATGCLTVTAVAVFALGQWISYLGPIPSLLIDWLVCFAATLVATTMVAVCATAWRRLARTRRPWRSPLARATVGLVCGLATFGPVVIDAHFAGIYDVESGQFIGRGCGTAFGWAFFFTGPIFASTVLLQNTEARDP